MEAERASLAVAIAKLLGVPVIHRPDLSVTLDVAGQPVSAGLLGLPSRPL